MTKLRTFEGHSIKDVTRNINAFAKKNNIIKFEISNLETLQYEGQLFTTGTILYNQDSSKVELKNETVSIDLVNQLISLMASLEVKDTQLNKTIFIKIKDKIQEIEKSKSK